MAIRASDAVDGTTMRNNEMATRLEQIIDRHIEQTFELGKPVCLTLDAHYGGGGQWGVEPPVHIKVPEAVRSELKTRYERAGWRVKFDETDCQRDGYSLSISLWPH